MKSYSLCANDRESLTEVYESLLVQVKDAVIDLVVDSNTGYSDIVITATGEDTQNLDKSLWDTLMGDNPVTHVTIMIKLIVLTTLMMWSGGTRLIKEVALCLQRKHLFH